MKGNPMQAFKWNPAQWTFVSAFLLLALTLGTLVGPLTSSYAYNVYHVVPLNYKTGVSYGISSILFGPDAVALQNSMNSWNARSATKFANVGSNEQLDVVDAYYGNNGWFGQTHVYGNGVNCGGTGYQQAGKPFTTMINATYTLQPNWPDGERQEVVAHELGHAIGLDHNNVLGVLMNTNTGVVWGQQGIDNPQTDDLNGAAAIRAAAPSC